MILSYSLTRRNAVVVLMIASCLYVLFTIVTYDIEHFLPMVASFRPARYPLSTGSHFKETSRRIDFGLVMDIPATSIVAHAPGWTLFRNLYMSNGTIFLVYSETKPESFPAPRMMISTSLPAFNTPENIAQREPTKEVMDFISSEDARRRWGGDHVNGERNRIWSIEGITLLVNDPPQFLDHYYHFVGEFLLGTWAFMYGAFNPSTGMATSDDWLSAYEGNASFNYYSDIYQPPPFARVSFMHAPAGSWRDKPGLNSFILRAVFPSTAIEMAEDWADRVIATAPPAPPSSDLVQHSRNLVADSNKAWHFPLVLLTDRSAAHRGEACGQRTQRIAAEAWEYMVRQNGIDLIGRWWQIIRETVWRFSGVVFSDNDDLNVSDSSQNLPLPEKIVITYISRQTVRRHLIQADHDALSDALRDLIARKRDAGKSWELNIVEPEMLSKDEQISLISKTTILLGVHGNGLTHAIFMKPTRLSAVLEIFYPGGFARDYEWTTRSLGIRHFSIWNDTYFTHPNEPMLGYPEGFHGTSIPVHGRTVAHLIEDWLEGTLSQDHA
ncbi:hypothetical protein BDQ17DRAFT_1310868 [Cyathus striatus]|nr:hypothetical protein BDQ17DRAFT_1310868 [Cyathus striatus]